MTADSNYLECIWSRTRIVWTDMEFHHMQGKGNRLSKTAALESRSTAAITVVAAAAAVAGTQKHPEQRDTPTEEQQSAQSSSNGLLQAAPLEARSTAAITATEVAAASRKLPRAEENPHRRIAVSRE
eukprot:1162100-Pelagomonas_calceolata.AAC.5